MATVKDFMVWVERDLRRFGKIDDHVEKSRVTADSVNGETAFTICVYTDVHRYSISTRNPELRKFPRDPHHWEKNGITAQGPIDWSAIPHDERFDDGYLGCIASCRKPRAGEDWHRGNDLADGPLTEETWRRILADIVSYEMVRVHRRQEPRADQLGQSAIGPSVGPVAMA